MGLQLSRSTPRQGRPYGWTARRRNGSGFAEEGNSLEGCNRNSRETSLWSCGSCWYLTWGHPSRLFLLQNLLFQLNKKKNCGRSPFLLPLLSAALSRTPSSSPLHPLDFPAIKTSPIQNRNYADVPSKSHQGRSQLAQIQNAIVKL